MGPTAVTSVGVDAAGSVALSHPRTIGWLGTTAMAMGGANQSLFLIGALISAQGSAAVPLLFIGLLLAWAALPGWTELILMWPNRVGGIASTCAEAFKPYSPVLASLTGVCYWWGWVPTCGLTALLSATALHQWYLPAVPVKLLAAGIIVVFTVANLAGLRRVTRLAVVIAAGSAVLAFLSAIVPVFAGDVDWHQATSFHLVTPFGGVFGQFTSAMAGLYLIGFAAPAFEAAACHVGETINPNKNVPRAMYASAAVATLYFLVLPVVWLGVFGPPALTADLANTLGPTFGPLLGGMAQAAAVWFMVLNMFHGTLTPVTGVARTLSQLSEDGLLPRVLAKRSRTDVPWVASTLTAAMALGFMLGGDPVWVIAAANFTYLIGISLPSVAVWLLRKNEPDLPRPYRAPRGTIMLGLLAAIMWGLATVFGFQQFGLPTVLFGLALAYSGAGAYTFRRWRDRAGSPKRVQRSLHLKLTGSFLAVMMLDGAGYLLAVSNATGAGPELIAILEDIFVAVAILTLTVGLVLPGMIAHGATEVTQAADRLVSGTLADLTRAMRALADGDLEGAKASGVDRHVAIRSADELGAIAESFNVILDESSRAASSLDRAREALLKHRHELEQMVLERTSHAAHQAAVAGLGRAALSTSNPQDLGGFAVTAAITTLGAGRAGLVEYHRGEEQLTLMTAQPKGTLLQSIAVLAGSSWLAAINADKPLFLTGAQAQEPFGLTGTTGTGMWAPISVQNKAYGGLIAQSDEEQAFTEADLSFLQALANVVGSAINRIRTEQELHHQALHDPLTGLPNRVLFEDRLALSLARLKRHPASIAVMFVDVDNFKVINDSLGHDHGDNLLIMIAERLLTAIRPGDTVARFGGDEFVILCEDVLGDNDAVGIGERILELAATPLAMDGRDHIVTVSTGIAIATAHDTPAANLLRDADAAMYQSKEAGRARTTIFADSMRTQAIRRLDTELALRKALSHGEFRLYYQPIVNLPSGSIAGVEALVRWEHPTSGIISPADFIPIAEETGLIVPLGEWVLGEACRQAHSWREAHLGLEEMTVSVNLSGRQIAQSDLVSVVANVLTDSGLDPGALVLEITESVLMGDAEGAIVVLQSLKDLGVLLSVDDFGTGYSSLSYLKKFPVDVLKIDQSFVNGISNEGEDAAIVKATISLAGSLGLTTVGEGVETPDQAEALTHLGGDKAQGYLFSRPLSAEAVEEVLLDLLVPES